MLEKSKIEAISRSLLIFIFCILLFQGLGSKAVLAEEKIWSQGGDEVSFEDGANWTPAGKPSIDDDAVITKTGSDVDISKTFDLKSISIGGKGQAILKTEDFISGEITPDENTDNALYIKKDAEVTLEGAGQIKLKGTFKNSEETLVSTPGFMFSAE